MNDEQFAEFMGVLRGIKADVGCITGVAIFTSAFAIVYMLLT